MKTIVSVIGAVVIVGGVTGAVALAAGPAAPATPATQPAAPAPAAETPHITSLKDIKWGPAPPGLPPGSQAAVMVGDPGAKGFVSLRAKLPAGYKIPPHFHPTDEHVTVLSGSLVLGMGDKIDAKTATTLKVGGYITAGAQMHHYAMTKTGAVIQVDLEGPFEITYVNAADDPRKKTP